jgi:glycosyltransferase involved in cell wall biosynthesis
MVGGVTGEWVGAWWRGARAGRAPLPPPVSLGGERPLRILYYGTTVDYAGTWRGHERIIEALDRTRFEPWVFYWPGARNTRLDRVAALVGGDHMVPFARSAARGIRRRGYRPRFSNFGRLARALDFDILHVARSGFYEWPLVERLAPLHVETSVFGGRDTRGVLDRCIAPCAYLAGVRGGADAVVYTPIPAPALHGDSLREQLGIRREAIVCGRIGRPANFHPIGLAAFARLVAEFPHVHYVIVAPCEATRAWVAAHRVPNVVFLPPTDDDALIAAFHRTLDVFLHYRADGETYGTALQQALAYGIPAVSHLTGIWDGQVETIGDGGVVARDAEEYHAAARRLVADPAHRARVAARARERARAFEQAPIVRRVEQLYLAWHAEAVRVR